MPGPCARSGPPRSTPPWTSCDSLTGARAGSARARASSAATTASRCAAAALAASSCASALDSSAPSSSRSPARGAALPPAHRHGRCLKRPRRSDTHCNEAQEQPSQRYTLPNDLVPCATPGSQPATARQSQAQTGRAPRGCLSRRLHGLFPRSQSARQQTRATRRASRTGRTRGLDQLALQALSVAAIGGARGGRVRERGVQLRLARAQRGLQRSRLARAEPLLCLRGAPRVLLRPRVCQGGAACARLGCGRAGQAAAVARRCRACGARSRAAPPRSRRPGAWSGLRVPHLGESKYCARAVRGSADV